MINVKTTRYQCSGCDHLCALLLDGMIKPQEIIKCELGKWREITKDDLKGGGGEWTS